MLESCWKWRWQIISYHVCAFWQRDWHLPLLRFLLISFLHSCSPHLSRPGSVSFDFVRECGKRVQLIHLSDASQWLHSTFFWQIYPQAYDTHSQSLYRRRILKSLTCLLTFSVWRNKEKSKVHSQKDWSFGRCQTTYRKSFEATFWRMCGCRVRPFVRIFPSWTRNWTSFSLSVCVCVCFFVV